MSKYKLGVWTPRAVVLCVECHGPKFPSNTFDTDSDKWKSLIGLNVFDKENNTVTTCDRCNDPLQIENSVGLEHKLAKELRAAGIKAEMWQTGGMNSACGIDKVRPSGKEDTEGLYYLITYDFDGDGMFWLCGYDEECNYIDNETFCTTSFNEMRDHVLKLQDIAKK